MSADNPSSDAIRDQAARWAARLNDTDLGDAEREELHLWLLADARHSNEFRAHNAIVALAHELPAGLKSRLSAYAPASAGAYEEPKRRWMWPSALAASLLAALVAGWFFFGRDALMAQSFATRTGETRTITFEDGSVAHLNTRTQLKWTGGSRDRRVTMLEGEALFDVVPDPARPFHVVLDNSDIHVLGTRFNVYRKKNGETAVTVLEGVVDVHEHPHGNSDESAWQRRLSANQQIVYQPLGLLGDVREISGEKAIKWRQGILEINNEPLPTVLEELTRYTDQRIVIRDPALNQLRIGGVLNVRDVRVALARLQKLAPVEITESGDTFTLAYQTQRH